MIHYHGTPISGDTAVQVRALKAKHAMVSFASSSHVGLVAEVCQSFCIDNGAFSAWKGGKALDIEGYAEFVEHWLRHPAFDFYVIPDVIDGAVEENLKLLGRWSNITKHRMLSHGAPVWHMHEPIEVLRDYCNAFYRVCIGSSGEYSVIGSARWWSRMAEAMTAVTDDDGFPKCKLHGLRMLDPTVFSHIPLSSADSTNVARNAGIDTAWKGTYIPQTREARALILSERIESHASAMRWAGSEVGALKNEELFG